jgi:hypothetical protein
MLLYFILRVGIVQILNMNRIKISLYFMKGFENRKKFESLIDGGLFSIHPSSPASLSPQHGVRPMASPEARGHSSRGQPPCPSSLRTQDAGSRDFPLLESYLQRSRFGVGLKQIKMESALSTTWDQTPCKKMP